MPAFWPVLRPSNVTRSRAMEHLKPGPRSMGIALNVVADARLAGPESLASHALTFDNRRIRRELHFSDDVWKSADSGRQLQPRGVRLRHENCGAKKLSLLDRGFANHPEHFARGLRSQDSFVRR